jgi:flagellar basal-body rod modification protein FlgD
MATSGISGVGQDVFLKLLITQLQNQDPLNPVSDKDFIAQMASLNTVQGINNLNATFTEVLKLQQLTNGASLIGKTVDFKDSDGNPTSGTVDSLKVDNGQFVLDVGGASVGLDQVTSVSDATPAV